MGWEIHWKKNIFVSHMCYRSKCIIRPFFNLVNLYISLFFQSFFFTKSLFSICNLWSTFLVHILSSYCFEKNTSRGLFYTLTQPRSADSTHSCFISLSGWSSSTHNHLFLDTSGTNQIQDLRNLHIKRWHCFYWDIFQSPSSVCSLSAAVWGVWSCVYTSWDIQQSLI
jgi:hypothetical protein